MRDLGYRSSGNHGIFVTWVCEPGRWTAGKCRGPVLLDRLWVFPRGLVWLSGARGGSYAASGAFYNCTRLRGLNDSCWWLVAILVR